MNWVDRKAQCAQNLNKSPEVWQEATTAIVDCCDSFRENYAALADVVDHPENGHRIVITIRFIAINVTRYVAVEFSALSRKINVTIDDKKAEEFDISSDETHAYISYQQKEISPDRFTQLALESALFSPPKPQSPPGYRTAPRGDTTWG